MTQWSYSGPYRISARETTQVASTVIHSEHGFASAAAELTVTRWIPVGRSIVCCRSEGQLVCGLLAVGCRREVESVDIRQIF